MSFFAFRPLGDRRKCCAFPQIVAVNESDAVSALNVAFIICRLMILLMRRLFPHLSHYAVALCLAAENK